MGKEPRDMTLEELWELFPITLVEHDDGWREQYEAVEKRLAVLLGDFGIARVSHVGSTAVGGIKAKAIVDVLVEASEGESVEAVAARLEEGGFTRMSATDNRVSLNLGYTGEGFAEKVYHVHVRKAGDNDELYFRDYLNAHPQAAREYEALKMRLWKEFERDRDAYTDGKAEFVRRCTDAARAEYAGRY